MKINTSDKVIAYLTLLSGLAISGVAEYYSIMGLIAIYPAAFWPIVVMGVVLGVGKISGTVWIKQNWLFAPWFLKAYILPAIAVLMIITSLGVFGFLSKAHSDQSLVSGDVQSKIAVYDEKIKTAKENIDANRKILKQMDEAVDQSMARSTDEKGADKAVAIRRGQQKERTRLASEIAAEQKTISKLSEERAPIAAEVRKVEAEVGPVKYIAHLLYGENPDANILEKAVIWVTVLIVIVLDPLAVILLLASQFSFQRFRQVEEEEEDTIDDVEAFFARGKEVARRLDEEAANNKKFAEAEEVTENLDEINLQLQEAAAEEISEPLVEIVEEVVEPKKEIQWAVKQPEAELDIEQTYVAKELEDHAIIESATISEAEAMTRWKQNNPDSSLKLQRRLLELGKIDHLPWEDYLTPDAALEAAKWADENPQTEEAAKAKEWASEQVADDGVDEEAFLKRFDENLKNQPTEILTMGISDVERPGDYIKPEESKKKDNMDGESGQTANNEKSGGLAGYVQNAEQSSVTLWHRVQKAKE